MYSMDYEHLLRACRDDLKILYKNIFISRWKDGGIGSGKIPEILKEYHHNRLENKVANKIFLNFIYYYSLFKFFINSKILRRA